MTLHIRPCLSFFTRCTTQTPILSLALSKGQLRLPTSCTYHSQQITKQLRKCSFTDTTYLNTDFCMEIYPRLRSISHDVVAKADKSKNSSKTTRCHARPELDFGSSIKEQTNKSRRPQSGSAPCFRMDHEQVCFISAAVWLSVYCCNTVLGVDSANSVKGQGRDPGHV